MYTFAALPVARTFSFAPRSAAQTPAVRKALTMAAPALQQSQPIPSQPVPPPQVTPPVTQPAPQPVPVPVAQPQQPIVVYIPAQETKMAAAPAAPEEKWYRSPQLIGGVVSVVVLTVLGMLVQKAGTRANIT